MASRISPYVDNTGLVFAYDLANTNRSYLGKPTTNRFATEITDPTLDSLAIGNGAGSNPQLGSGGICAVALFEGEKVLAINRGTSSGVYNENRVYWSIALTAGNYYSWSAWVYSTVAGPTLQLEYYGGDYNWGVAQSYNTHTGTGWERLYAYASAPASSNTQTYCFIYVNTNNNIYAKDFQLENQQYPTQFINGTRSVTQGLKDLTGRSTIDLTNVSFDSNAQMTFDGTNDQIVLDDYASSIPYGGTITVETIVKFYSFTPNDVIVAYGGNNTNFGWLHQYEFTAGLMFGIQNNPSYGTAQIGTEASQQYLNKFIHMVGTYDGTTVRLYINGNSVASQSYTAGIPQSTTFRIGNESGRSYYSNMDLPLARIYNRALTASEIQQNFNAIKGRYGL